MLQIAYEKAESVRHRADLQKLMVASAHHRRGVARALLRDALSRMRALGLAMYTITTAFEGPAELLVRETGFTRYGVMPHYGVTPDGKLHDASLHYISIASAEALLELS
jgi:GNAT superfamily N-acetyltransferase